MQTAAIVQINISIIRALNKWGVRRIRHFPSKKKKNSADVGKTQADTGHRDTCPQSSYSPAPFTSEPKVPHPKNVFSG